MPAPRRLALAAALLLGAADAAATPLDDLAALCADATLSHAERVAALEALGYGPAEGAALARLRQAGAVIWVVASDRPAEEVMTGGGALIAASEADAAAAFERMAETDAAFAHLAGPGGFEVTMSEDLEPRSDTTARRFLACTVTAATLPETLPPDLAFETADFGRLAVLRTGDATGFLVLPTPVAEGGTLPAHWTPLGLAAFFQSTAIAAIPQAD